TTSTTISGLAPGATYFFAATAYDSLGVESPFSNEISYLVPTAASNQPPRLDLLANLVINENAGPQTVPLSGISSGDANQTLTVVATSSSPGLIPNPVVNYSTPNTSGNLILSPVPYAFGTATITVTVNDGQPTSNTISRSFIVTVNPVNQTPTLDPVAN